MPYQRVNWVNYPDTSTPIDEINLGHMEDGIETAVNGVEDLQKKVPTIVPTLTKGTKIATITVDKVPFDLLAPEGGGGGGSNVSYTPTVTSGTQLGTLTIDDTEYQIYAPQAGDSVSFTPTLTKGTKIGEITIGTATQSIYASSISYSDSYSKGMAIGTLTIDDTAYVIHIPESTYIPTITEGVELGKITLNGVDHTIYAPQGQSGSSVVYVPTITSGETIGTLTIDGTDNILYMNNVYLTMEAYEALPESKLTDGKHYYIIDAEQQGVISPFRLGIDEYGNYGYYKLGETVLTPFGSGGGAFDTVGTFAIAKGGNYTEVIH